MEKIVQRLEKTGAKLIFATTTMVPDKEVGRYAEDVEKYNTAALEVMSQHPQVKVVDLYPYSKKIHKIYGLGDDNVHYTTKGYSYLAVPVLKAIVESAMGQSYWDKNYGKQFTLSEVK